MGLSWTAVRRPVRPTIPDGRTSRPRGSRRSGNGARNHSRMRQIAAPPGRAPSRVFGGLCRPAKVHRQVPLTPSGSAGRRHGAAAPKPYPVPTGCKIVEHFNVTEKTDYVEESRCRCALERLVLHLRRGIGGHPNTADAVALAQGLHGVGPAKAEAIVAYREKNGPFKSVDDLVAVQGIGEQTVKVNREHMTVGAPTPSE
jgi:competence protein ComEA